MKKKNTDFNNSLTPLGDFYKGNSIKFDIIKY